MPTPSAAALLAHDLEVVTVTDTSLIITWFTGSATESDAYGEPAPVPADTELLLGEPGQPATMRTVLHDATPTPYHYAEITGLEPGRTYAYGPARPARPRRRRHCNSQDGMAPWTYPAWSPPWPRRPVGICSPSRSRATPTSARP